MRTLLREFHYLSQYLYKLIGIVMAFDFASIDRSTVAAFMSKYLNQSILLIDYIPFVGPLYNATYALNLIFSFWPSKSADADEDNPSDVAIIEKSRMIRVKGLTAIATALIDIFTLCLAVGVIAFVCDCLVRINTFAIVRYLLILFILANVVALTVGSKIITGQLVANVTRQLEDVNSVSTSMVKSVTITATAIEKIVETTNTKTSAFVTLLSAWWTQLVSTYLAIVNFPSNTYRAVTSKVELRMLKYKMQMRKMNLQCRQAARTVRHYVMPFKKD